MQSISARKVHAPNQPQKAGLHVGTAGWSVPLASAAAFPADGSHLERYSAALDCAEINSSFYRPHRPSTYARWAATTPPSFRFSVKVPKAITHECDLAPTLDQVNTFLDEVNNLGEKLGPILFQLPPRQGFDELRASAFFSLFRDLYPQGQAALEPRHPSWFTADAARLLDEFRLARVAADPPICPEAASPAGYRGLTYYRLHGSPRTYYSSYATTVLDDLAIKLAAPQSISDVWCIFDNTASGAATANALILKSNLTIRKPESHE